MVLSKIYIERVPFYTENNKNLSLIYYLMISEAKFGKVVYDYFSDKLEDRGVK